MIFDEGILLGGVADRVVSLGCSWPCLEVCIHNAKLLKECILVSSFRPLERVFYLT